MTGLKLDKKKITIYIILTAAVIFILLQLSSCTFLEGFQLGKPESGETASTGDNGPVDLDGSDNSVGNESDDLSEISDDDDSSGMAADNDSQNGQSPGGQSYTITQADRNGMKNKIETEHYIFYFNSINEEFLNTYVSIAEDGSDGLKIIFGEDPASKIEIFLCEELEELEIVSEGIVPPGFEGNEPIGQSINGAVHIFKPEEFMPGPGDIDKILSYKIGLLHEIGHAYYFMIYPDAAKKNDWLDEALADKSITGKNINPDSISNPLLKELIANGEFVALSKLEGKGRRTFSGNEDAIFSEYISFVNFIASQFGFDTLNLFLSEYNNPKDLLTSLETAAGLDPASFEEQWLEEIQNSI
jgi:hypothetical protein